MDFFNGNMIHSQILRHWRKILTEVSMEIERCPATTMKWRPNTSSGQKKPKTQESLQQRPAKWILKQDSSGDLSSSEKSEETLFKSEEEDKDY